MTQSERDAVGSRILETQAHLLAAAIWSTKGTRWVGRQRDAVLTTPVGLASAEVMGCRGGRLSLPDTAA